MINLSVIIPTYFAQKTIERCLSAIRTSTYKKYELIIVDDASRDNTVDIAQRFTQNIIQNPKNLGKIETRKIGVHKARGKIIVNIDQDVVIRSDTLGIIANYFAKHHNVDALTCLLSKHEPFTNFTSQYKNLYMHYYFKRLPKHVHFLYGSLYAIRKKAINKDRATVKAAEDTEEGQMLMQNEKTIALLKSLEVVHLKQYTLTSLIKNDFIIPFGWAQIFLKYRGWKQLGRNKTGFAHASKEQIISLLLVPFCVFLLFLTPLFPVLLPLDYTLLFVWFLLHISFFSFLSKERGVIFGMQSILFTFVDHFVMATGVVMGVIQTIPVPVLHKK